MLTCKETARLISEGMDRKLPLRQRINLRLHLMMCGVCATYRQQIELLDRLIRQRFADPTDATTPDVPGCCPAQAKERIAQVLSDHQHDGH